MGTRFLADAGTITVERPWALRKLIILATFSGLLCIGILTFYRTGDLASGHRVDISVRVFEPRAKQEGLGLFSKKVEDIFL